MNKFLVLRKVFSTTRTLLNQRSPGPGQWTRLWSCKVGSSMLPSLASRSRTAKSLRLLAKMSGAALLVSLGYGSTQMKTLLASSPSQLEEGDVSAPNLAEILSVADQFYECNKMEEALRYLEVFHDSSESEILWRLARLCYKVGRYHSNHNEAKALSEKALYYSERAVEVDESNFACHKWMGIILSWASEFEGTRRKIERSFDIRDHFLMAIELNPKDPTSMHLLGQWCYSVSNIPWYQKKIASVVFATPPYSTHEEALSHFEAAERVEPGFYSTNWLFIGKCYLQLGRVQEGGKWLKKTVSYPCQNKEDLSAKKEAEELLKKLEIS